MFILKINEQSLNNTMHQFLPWHIRIWQDWGKVAAGKLNNQWVCLKKRVPQDSRFLHSIQNFELATRTSAAYIEIWSSQALRQPRGCLFRWWPASPSSDPMTTTTTTATTTCGSDTTEQTRWLATLTSPTSSKSCLSSADTKVSCLSQSTLKHLAW